ncbi:synaptojanin-2-binding protein [Lissotriton helveticus]
MTSVPSNRAVEPKDYNPQRPVLPVRPLFWTRPGSDSESESAVGPSHLLSWDQSATSARSLSSHPGWLKMNGRADLRIPEEEIHLKRGPAGLGFNIVGGTNQQFINNDDGIFVSRIKEGGAAALDGRLQEGDKILMVNGRELKKLLHNEAVDLFREAGEDVVLRVQHRSQIQNGPSNHKSDGEHEGLSVAVFLVPAFIALTSVTIWAVMKYRQRM